MNETIDVFAFSGIPVAVLGLGKSGLVAARALHRSGAEVMAWDDDATRRDTAADEGVPIVDLSRADLADVPTLVLSPGIPHTFPKPHPVVTRAKAAGAEIIGDIELLARTQREATYVGITGTNGKSTTTSLIGHILSLTGRTVAVGGNLGTPALSLDALGAEGIYVLEMSSYQLDLTVSITWDVALLLNISPDHLDRHGGMDGYVAAKRSIFWRQTKPRAAVIGIDDAICRGIRDDLVAAGDQVVLPISGQDRATGGVYVEDGWLIDDTAGGKAPVMDLSDLPRLPGTHNRQNAAAAYAATRHLGVAPHAAAGSIASFPGLAHRQELVATIDGIRYVNDFKATNADAAARALVCYDAIYWIAGGVAKEGGIASLEPFFPRIRHAFLIGAAAADFAATLGARVPHTIVGTLDAAIAAARAQAVAEGHEGAVVLLSPACASFDQFANFESRGAAFRRLVEALPGGRA